MELKEQRTSRHSGSGTRNRRLAAFAVLATAVLGATAACTGSSSSPSGLGGTSTAGTSLSPTATATGTATATTTQAGTTSATSTGATSSSAATSAANGANPSASPRAASGGTAPCTGSEIKVTLGSGGAAMSHDGIALVFTNTSSHACTMQGYPGAAIMNGSTVLVNATRTLNGYIGDEQQLSSTPLVTLAPGFKASAMVESLANAGETCYPNGTGTLEVTPPNTTATVGLRTLTVGSGGVCAGFEVHPVVAGTFSG
jgi:Protein of unknown function (DUF4232)